MTAPVDNKVSLCTPIHSADHSCIRYPAIYLQPFGGDRAMHFPLAEVLEDGSEGCERATYRAPWWETTLKIASYILTLGILPLIAFLANVAIRCKYNFHWVQPENPPIDMNELKETLEQIGEPGGIQRMMDNPLMQRQMDRQLGNLGLNPALAQNLRNPMQALPTLLEQANQLRRDLPPPRPNPQANTPSMNAQPRASLRVHTVHDPLEVVDLEQPSTLPPKPRLSERAGGYRLGGK